MPVLIPATSVVISAASATSEGIGRFCVGDVADCGPFTILFIAVVSIALVSVALAEMSSTFSNLDDEEKGDVDIAVLDLTESSSKLIKKSRSYVRDIGQIIESKKTTTVRK